MRRPSAEGTRRRCDSFGLVPAPRSSTTPHCDARRIRSPQAPVLRCGDALRALLLLALAAGAAHADVRARIVATDPPADATLGRDQQFFVRIQFDADEPVSLWTRAYAGGKRIEKGYEVQRVGEVVGIRLRARLDLVRRAGGRGRDPHRRRRRQAVSSSGEVASYPVKLRWGDGPAAARDRPVGARAPARDRRGVGGGAAGGGGEPRHRRYRARARADAALPRARARLRRRADLGALEVARLVAARGGGAVRGHGVRRRAHRRRHRARPDLAQPLAVRDPATPARPDSR